MPNGLKTWVYLQSVEGLQRQTLGVYPDMTLEEARKAWAEVAHTSRDMGNPGGGLLEESTSRKESLPNSYGKQTRSDITMAKAGTIRRVLAVASAFVAVGLGGVFVLDHINYSELSAPWSEKGIVNRARMDDKTNTITHPLSAANPPSPAPADIRLSKREPRADLVALATLANQKLGTSTKDGSLFHARGLISQVARAQFTNGVEDREPIDELGPMIHVQGEDIKQLYFFTDIRGMSGETVTHRWQHEGQVVAEIAFDIKGDRWRVFSSKNLLPTTAGHWEVVVIDSSGTLMHKSSFFYLDSQGEIPDPAYAVKNTMKSQDRSILAHSQGSAEHLTP